MGSDEAAELGAIDVGAADGDLRYWLAKEGLRQGEVRIGAQNGVRTALEARATAITGWAAVGFLAISGASFTAKEPPAVWGATVAAAMLFAAGVVCILAARPRNWSMLGYSPDVIMEMQARFATELEALESMCGGLADGMKVNNRRLDRMGSALRWGGWLLICSPVAGVAAYYLRSRFI